MDIKEFISKFVDNLMEDDVTGINEQTEFRKLSSWDSLTGMAIVTMIESDYKIKVDLQKFKSFVTVGDLYKYVNSEIPQ
jgi:acyl carrier protein